MRTAGDVHYDISTLDQFRPRIRTQRIRDDRPSAAAGTPVMALGRRTTARTRHPRRSSYSQVCRPMNPLAPVTRAQPLADCSLKNPDLF